MFDSWHNDNQLTDSIFIGAYLMLKTRERIITISDLQQDPDTVLQNAQQQPLLVTAGGRPAAYVFGVEMFDALMERLLDLERNELVASIAEGERQFDSGRYLSLRDAAARAESRWQTEEESME
jgi:prevent-host-death family protein